MDQRIPFLFINQRRNPCPGYVILNVSNGETRTEGLNLDPNYQCMYSNGTWALLWEYAYQQANIVAVRLMLLNLEEACGKTIGMLIADEAGDGVYPEVPLTGTFIGEPSRNDFQIFLIEGIDDDNFCTLWKSSFENDFEDGEIVDDGDITISWTRHQIKIPGGYDDAYSLIHWDTNLYWIGTGGVFSYNLETEEVTSYHFLVGIKHSNDQLGNGPRAYLFIRNSHVLYVCASSDEDICIGVLAKNDDVGLIIPLDTFLTSDDGEIHLLDTFLSPLDGDIRLLGAGALFLNRRQAGIYIENVSLLNFVNTLSEGPHPHDCKTYNLTTKAWRLQRHCNLENCQGVWFLSENENLGRCMLRISHLLCPLERLLKEKEKREKEEGEEEEEEEEEEDPMVTNQELLFQLTMGEDLLWRLTEPESWQETTRHSSFGEASTSAQAEDAPIPYGLTLEALQALGKEGAQVLVYSGSLEGNLAMPHLADTPCSKAAPVGAVVLGTPATPPVSSIFTLPFTAFKEEVAKEFGIPVQFQRYWLWAKRQNHTYRPRRLLTSLEELQTVGTLREASNKAHNAEMKLSLEVERGVDFSLLPLPDKSREDILIYFKLYDPEKEELRYVGRMFLKAAGKPIEILAKLNELAGFPDNEKIELYEIKFEPNIMCEPIDKRISFKNSQLEDGDIICIQKAIVPESETNYRYPDVPSFLEYVHNRQIVHFRLLEKPKEDNFSLELSKLHTYDDVVERVARHVGLDDPSKILLTSHNCYSQRPKPQPIRYRGVEYYLSDMPINYNQTLDILYSEVLDIPLPELQGLKTLKIVCHQSTKDEVVSRIIRLRKNNTVGDVINDLKSKNRHTCEKPVKIYN